MRLVCPNCGAQYEVDDRVIPENGRDVQCSACGHGWYQTRKELSVSEEGEPAPELIDEPVADAEEPETEPVVEDAPTESEMSEEAAESAEDINAEPEVTEAEAIENEDEPAVEDRDAEAEPVEEADPTEAVNEEDVSEEPLPEDEPTVGLSDDEAIEPAEDDEDEDEDEAEDELPPAASLRPRTIDEGVRSVLREEAQREIEAREGERQREPEAMETQPDLGLETADDADEARRREARAQIARMRGFDDEAPEADFDMSQEAPAPRGPSRDLFPDIEEINSTLDSHDSPDTGGADGDTDTGGRGFSRGFFLIIFVAALLLTLYLVAPQLAKTVPALKPALTVYVDTVNSLRLVLDDLLKNLIAKINDFVG